MIFHTTDAAFQTDVLDSNVPVLVDFWAPWCGPCKALVPILEQLAETLKDYIKIVQMNIDENPQTPTSYKVTSLPSLFLFQGDKVIEKMVGLNSHDVLEQWVRTGLGLKK